MSKRKYAVPGTYVPGASLVRDPNTLAIIYDKKGRPLWHMPKPKGTHETVQVVKVLDKTDPDKPRQKKVKQPMQFPVYGAMTSSLAREIRCKMRREKRIADEKGINFNPLEAIKRVLMGGYKNGEPKATAAGSTD